MILKVEEELDNKYIFYHSWPTLVYSILILQFIVHIYCFTISMIFLMIPGGLFMRLLGPKNINCSIYVC